MVSANSTRPLPIARNQSDKSISDVLSRAGTGYSADVYAPGYAPLQEESVVETETRADRLVTRSVRELRPHPSYARHNLSVEPVKLAALEEQGERAFSHPLVVTRDECIIDGYARWELAKRKDRPTLKCIECDLTAEEALEELIRRHRRSHGLADFIRIELALDLESYFKDKALHGKRVQLSTTTSTSMASGARRPSLPKSGDLGMVLSVPGVDYESLDRRPSVRLECFD